MESPFSLKGKLRDLSDLDPMHQCTRPDTILTCAQFEHMVLLYQEVIGTKIMRRFSFFLTWFYVENLSPWKEKPRDLRFEYFLDPMHQCTRSDTIPTCVQFEHVAVLYHEVIGTKIMRRFSFFLIRFIWKPLSPNSENL